MGLLIELYRVISGHKQGSSLKAIGKTMLLRLWGVLVLDSWIVRGGSLLRLVLLVGGVRLYLFLVEVGKS